jgi:ParB family chromosome partitioning protein
MPAKTPRKKRAKAPAPATRGLSPAEVAAADAPPDVDALRRAIAADGGAVLAAYRDPLGGRWQVFAALPLDRVEPTPYQRDLSKTHVGRLTDAIQKLDRFLDPVIAVRTAEGKYSSPNGHHRLGALRALGARTITALVVPDREVAHRILALNTEKAHNVRERALEVTRLEQGLAAFDDRPETAFEAEFEDPALLTLGLCYERNGRFSGGVYHAVLKRIEGFLPLSLTQAVAQRRERAGRLLELDHAVTETAGRLKARGFQSPYLKAFVVARIDPLRFKRGATGTFDGVLDTMMAAARAFDATKVKATQVAAAGGPPED